VNCSYNDISFDGTIVDISATGIAIHASDILNIDTDQTVRLFFNLIDTFLTVYGSFIRTAKSENDDQLYIFKMRTDPKQDIVINRFIYKRQIEIIQNLRDGFILE
jgi:c-di-GMP-binding flagellar brake protein YcgR